MEQDDRAGGPSVVAQELYCCAVVCVVGEVEADLVRVLGWDGHGDGGVADAKWCGVGWR